MLVLFDGDSAVADTFRLIEKQLTCGCWSWDLQTDRMEWSRGFFELLGVEAGSVTPSFAAIQHLTHPEDRRSQAEIEGVIREALSIQRKFRVIQPGGKVVWIFCQIIILVNAEGQAARAIGVCTDITHYHLSLSPLRVSDERYRALVKAAGALVWVAKADGMVKEYPNWPDFRTDPSDALLNQRWLDFIHPDDRAHTIKAWKEATLAKSRYTVEHRIRQADGAYIWKRTNAVPILDDAGEVKEWLGINADIQDEKYALLPGKRRGRVTGAQIRAARGLLRWSAEDLAEAAGTSRATIRRLEETDGPLADQEASLSSIENALSGAGVEFIFPEIGKPGIRPR